MWTGWKSPAWARKSINTRKRKVNAGFFSLRSKLILMILGE
jgi:hypothetical protein